VPVGDRVHEGHLALVPAVPKPEFCPGDVAARASVRQL
jgi:hypothetical protein